MTEVAIAIGVSVVTAALSYALTPKPTAQNQLDDLSILKSEFGVAIPKVYGRQKINGNIIWATDIKEDLQSGKGGPGEYKYSATFAALFCEGPIQNIARIWLNNKLVYALPSNNPSTVSASLDFAGDFLDIYLGTNNQDPDPTIQSVEGVANTPAFRNHVYLVFKDLPLETYGNIVPNVQIEVLESDRPDLGDVIVDACSRAGLTPNEVDVSELVGIQIDGAVFSQDGSPRDFIEELQKTYHFLARDSGDRIAFIPMTRNTIYSISQNDLDTRDEGASPGDLYEEIREQVLDLPSSVQIEYPNLNNNYKRAIQTAYKSTANHRNELNFKSTVIMDDSTALTAITKSLEYYWAQRIRYEKINLPANYLSILPGDLLSLPVRNTQKVLQASKVNRGANLIIEVEAVTYDASINDLTAISPTVGSYNPPITLPYAGQPTPLVLDTALLSDSDAEMGVYATAIPDPNGTGWSGGFLYGSPLGGSFSALEAIGAVAAQGQLLTELPVTGFFVVDRTTKVRVLMNQQILQSIPDYDFYAFKQIAYINGELISFQNANLVAPNAYELSNLIRGIRGTENLIATHATGSDFYLLKGNFGFIDIDGELAQLKNTYEFKAVPPGVSQTAINNIQTLTITGNRLKPYAPVNPRITRRPGNSLLVEWFRRSRKNGIWLDGVEDVPLNEANQAYDVEIFNGTTLMRTVTRSFPSYTYPNQHQIQDFGSLQNELTFKVYQKSIYIGRGYPLIANGLGISKFM